MLLPKLLIFTVLAAALHAPGRVGLIDKAYRWKFPIPYILSDSLDLNAKGAIHQAFEMYRLKSCVDFKPYEGEKTYIKFEKRDGCWSYVGDLQNGQVLSLGSGCDHKAVIEHELLHALGFYHTQSRQDRDDYVKIWLDQVTEGMGHNFNKYDDSFVTDLNTPYDYESVMHYRPFAFNKDPSIPTITTNIPEFFNIIGQYLDFSEMDVVRLNRMYNCSSSLTLLDQCAFENINICGMVQSLTDDTDWVHLKSSPGSEDHTLGGLCRDSGYTMHIDTSTGNAEQSALLESRILYPKRKLQCLQFFYKMTGGTKDRLVIWAKMDDGTGTVRKLKKLHTIWADEDKTWKIAHVSMQMGAKFRYAFQAVKGDPANSGGGIFIDDISLTETHCPAAVWRIQNFSSILETADYNTVLTSPRFYSPEGYGYGVQVRPLSGYSDYTGNYTGLYFHLASGDNDIVMQWPAVNRQATIVVMDQDPDIKLRMSSARSLTTDLTTVNGDQLIWDNPRKFGTFDPSCQCYRGESMGWRNFIKHFDLRRRNYLKNDDLIIFVDFEDLNAKGVILQAFEMYRLKSCVDFKPYEGESTYISFTKLDGCWSFVGDLKTGQNVSIGDRCDTKAIVEHELLHALGFYHEQSRSDRDDYVQIWWDQIIPGKEHNFNKYEDDFITDLNTPYDYESIMHYRPLSFNKNPDIPTITTTIPAFNNVIGQRLDFSALDLERLNRMYECTATHTLLDQCAFEQINICGMIQNDEDDADWVHTLSSTDVKDHTLGGHCRDAGYFMKFDATNKLVGHSALLESRILYPKRKQQCLEFFYRMSRGLGDQLIIWVRRDDGSGTVRKVGKVHTITGDGDESWKIAQVTLNVEEKFRYFFQGIVGSSNTSGGIFIDDITLTETACPNAVWRIQNFTNLLNTIPHGHRVQSPLFYNSDGYAYGIRVYPNGRINSSEEFVGITFHLFSGENDAVLEWPAVNRQVTVTTMDQNPDKTLQMSNSRSFTTDADMQWSKPSMVGEWDESCFCYRGPEFGWGTFISHDQLHRRDFLKNDDLIITVNFDDLAHLVKSEVPTKLELSSNPQPAEDNFERPKVRVPRAISDPCQPNPCRNGGACVIHQGRAACRCVSGQAIIYTGDTCEKQHFDGGILGVLIGGVAGTIALTVAIIAVIYRQN
ncbi:Meprin A subunit alpha [Anabarilius grahami]|uniref:Metalloendopeptidase n=1 Tax=Anabarilius grahami TaxID=495550 RepID=A0A3N0YC82_ANAGA|nr:Meprin A subunit alpha [Anabarilius grahami]